MVVYSFVYGITAATGEYNIFAKGVGIDKSGRDAMLTGCEELVTI